MILLALECSSDDRSVALARDSEVLAVAARRAGRATPLFGLVDELLASAGLERTAVEAIAVGLGPGSYTGIRSAIAAAQGWSLARDLRLLGLDSTAACAHRAHRLGLRGRTAIVSDAQRGEFYVATYDLLQDRVAPGAGLRLASRADVEALVRDGHRLAGPQLAAAGLAGETVAPDGASLVALAQGRTDFVPAEALEPIYLRATTFVKAPQPRSVPGIC